MPPATRAERFLLWLGFGAGPDPTFTAPVDGFTAAHGLLSAQFSLPLRSRLKVLFGGDVLVRVAFRGDFPLARVQAEWSHSVLPPAFRRGPR